MSKMQESCKYILYKFNDDTPSILINKTNQMNAYFYQQIKALDPSIDQHLYKIQQIAKSMYNGQRFCKQILQNIIQWNAKHFFILQQAKSSQIDVLAILSNIKLNNLLELNLSDTYIHITTIQPLAFLHFPQVKKLNLAYQNISSLKPFSKMNLKNLQKINIKFNKYPSKQLQYLNRCRVITETLEILCQDLHKNHIFKFKSKILFQSKNNNFP